MTLGTIAAAVGKGLFAGAAGTAAITASQMLAAKLQDGGSSDAPVEATEKVLGVTPTGKQEPAAMLPALRIAPPPTDWPPQQIAVDGLHHAVYAALAAGLAYEALGGDRQPTRR